jgi:hypothetical protein
MLCAHDLAVVAGAIEGYARSGCPGSRLSTNNASSNAGRVMRRPLNDGVCRCESPLDLTVWNAA